MDSRALALIPQALVQYTALRDLLVGMLHEAESIDRDLANFMKAQLHYIGERSQSLYLLVQDQRLWDAEILLRAISEATIKCLYVCYGVSADRPQKLQEFWEMQHLDSLLRESVRAEEVMKLRTTDNPSRQVFEAMLLGKNEKAEIEAMLPSKRRRELNQRWSFTGMVRALDAYMKSGEEKALFGSLLHNYGLSSHLIHADERAMSLIWDRRNRPERERSLLEACHLGRMLSDSLAYLGLIGLAFSSAIGLNQLKLKNTMIDVMSFFSSLEEIQADFYATQKEFYSQILG